MFATGPWAGTTLTAVAAQLTLNVLVLGVMLVLFVVGAPEGIIGLVRKARRKRNEGEA